MCGGTPPTPWLSTLTDGLSPRVRGNLRGRLSARQLPGSIPACAGEPPPCCLIWKPKRVYPRVCGGTQNGAIRDAGMRGLSPRVRGNPGCRRQAVAYQGSIPACAGEPGGRQPGKASSGVYPRVCGGTRLSPSPTPAMRGLSPRVRGNQGHGHQLQPRLWSIPACAGEPSYGNLLAATAKVYPRVCGGTRRRRWRSAGLPGLSPRVRGNHDVQVAPAPAPGSIPACAGEPIAPRLLAQHAAVYPRVCGGTGVHMVAAASVCGLSPRVRGNRWWSFSAHGSSGSIPACAGEPPGPPRPPRPPRGLSPRVRGNHRRPQVLHRNIRSIPACAGEPFRIVGQADGRLVYPRVCGGTIQPVDYTLGSHGLSPRVRGNLRAAIRRARRRGSIPACAGEPGPGAGRAGWAAVYPRVCGGTGWVGGLAAAHRGLSPRVRGNRPHHQGGCMSTRSIPACAGEPPISLSSVALCRVYPRVCGGTPEGKMETETAIGLSPRVRGNRINDRIVIKF